MDFQQIYHDKMVYTNLLNVLYNKYKIDNLTLAGGCAMNSVANGKISRRTPFKHIYIQSAAGDAGGAIGSACFVLSKLNSKDNYEKLTMIFKNRNFQNHEELDKEEIENAIFLAKNC